jgi:iron complex transport system permease protein
MTQSFARPLSIALLLLLTALLLSALVGSVPISPTDLLRLALGQLPPELAETYATILLRLRLPRTALMALAGASLAGSGAAYQGLFRNPLADPYLIGVAAGAGLGAVLAMTIQWPYSLLGLLAVPAAAFLGGLGSVLAVAALSQSANATLSGGRSSSASLLLAGVAVSAFTTAVTSLLMLRANGELRRALVWLMGGATLSGWLPVLALLPYVLLGLGVLLTMGHALNVLQFGEEQAQQLGLPVERVRRWVIAAATLVTAAAVAFSGIIGFIGLIVPHLVRLLTGSDYRRILPLSILGGAALLLFADVIARRLLAPQEIPVGVITALAGAPFFLWVLRRSNKGA